MDENESTRERIHAEEIATSALERQQLQHRLKMTQDNAAQAGCFPRINFANRTAKASQDIADIKIHAEEKLRLVTFYL